MQWPNFSRGCKRRKRCTDRCCSEGTHREISGEQTHPADRANRGRKRRRASGKRARRWQRPEQGRGSAGKSATTSELRYRKGELFYACGALTDGKRPFLIRRFKFFPSADIR